VRTVLAGLVTGGVVVVADLVARLTDGLLSGDTVGPFIGTVDGHDAVFTIDDDKRFFVAVDQRLQIDWHWNIGWLPGW